MADQKLPVDTNQLAAKDADQAEHEGQQRHADDPGPEAGRHDPTQRIDRHHLQAGELLGGLHQADLGGEGGACTTGEQQGGDHRAQLTEQGEGNQRPQALLCAEILQYVVTLQGEHHADEQA